MDRLNRTADLIGATRRILVTQTTEPSDDGVRASANLPALMELLDALAG